MDGIVSLVGAGFNEHEVIHEWPYDKFELLRKAVQRRDLERRQDFAIDVASAVAGVLGGKGKNPLNSHIDSIKEFIEDEL